MNRFQRYAATCRGEKTDFLPRTPILMHFAARHAGFTYAEFAREHPAMVETNIRCAEDFGIDVVDVMSDPYRETTAFGGEIEYLDQAVPRLIEPPLAHSTDLATLPRPAVMEASRLRNCIEGITLYKERVGDTLPIVGWVEGPAAEAADVRGVSQFLMDLMTDEAFACDLMDRCIDLAIEFAIAQIEAGAHTIGVGDAIASQVSPEIYERLIQPREKRLVDAIQASGGTVRLHICGNITHCLDGIAELGVDICDIDHLVDMKTAREKLGSGVVLTGNLDPAADVQMGSPESIREGVARIYGEVGNPFMVNAGCEIPVDTPEENLRALCEPVPYSA